MLPQLHFQPDAQEKDLEVFHRLKLYSDDDPTGASKKPVICVSRATMSGRSFVPCRGRRLCVGFRVHQEVEDQPCAKYNIV